MTGAEQGARCDPRWRAGRGDRGGGRGDHCGGGARAGWQRTGATGPLSAPPPAAAGISPSGPGGGLLTGGSSLPDGWAPVPYRRAQLSVPGSWLVQSPQQFSCGFPRAGGMIFAGGKPGPRRGWLRPDGEPGLDPACRAHTEGDQPPQAHGRDQWHSRLPAAGRSGIGAVPVPELGVRAGARGPLARRVLATLTSSPLSVVLRRGPAAPVPASWSWHRFGGVRFATPRSWSLQREDQWATCGTGLVPRWLLLSTRPDRRPDLPCPAVSRRRRVPGPARPDSGHREVRGPVGPRGLRRLPGPARRPNLPVVGHRAGRLLQRRADLLGLPAAAPRRRSSCSGSPERGPRPGGPRLRHGGPALITSPGRPLAGQAARRPGWPGAGWCR